MRGVVLGLTAAQRVARALYLAQEAALDSLDDFVDKDVARAMAVPGYMDANGVAGRGLPDREQIYCPTIYYLLKDHNGGKDPYALDPADRWVKPGSAFINRTSDCIGGAGWIGGWDRYQEHRFAYLYDGWINTDSMIEDARGKRVCFRELDQPEDGCYVVCASGSRGHKVGHIMTCTKAPKKFDRANVSDWHAIEGVDVAAYQDGGRANRRTTGAGWYDTRAAFIVPIMTP